VGSKPSRVEFASDNPLLILVVYILGWVQLQRSCVCDLCNTLLLLLGSSTHTFNRMYSKLRASKSQWRWPALAALHKPMQQLLQVAWTESATCNHHVMLKNRRDMHGRCLHRRVVAATQTAGAEFVYVVSSERDWRHVCITSFVCCRWCAPPGAGPVGVTIQVFQSDTLPQAADAQPLLTHTGFYAMQVSTTQPSTDL
jgi:hypothetical protein